MDREKKLVFEITSEQFAYLADVLWQKAKIEIWTELKRKGDPNIWKLVIENHNTGKRYE